MSAAGAHCSLQSWHYEWVQRQNHALLAVMRMYCQTLPRALLTPELKSDMLLDGAAAAAAARQALSPAVRAADLGVVLDTATVEEGAWLGCLVQTAGTQPRCAPHRFSRAACFPSSCEGRGVVGWCSLPVYSNPHSPCMRFTYFVPSLYWQGVVDRSGAHQQGAAGSTGDLWCRPLSPTETLAYLAWQERSVEHPAIMIALLEDCIQEVPRMIAAEASESGDAAATTDGDDDAGAVVAGGGRRRRDSVRRRSLALIAQKGSQMMRAADERGGSSTAAWLEEAWALLAAAGVQFRRCASDPPRTSLTPNCCLLLLANTIEVPGECILGHALTRQQALTASEVQRPIESVAAVYPPTVPVPAAHSRRQCPVQMSTATRLSSAFASRLWETNCCTWQSLIIYGP